MLKLILLSIFSAHGAMSVMDGGAAPRELTSLFQSSTPIKTEGKPESRDAFGRVRVAAPYSIFESQYEYGVNGELWVSSTIGSGAVTHRLNESSALLTIGAANGDRAVQQTRSYLRYQSGKSQLIFLTGVLGNGTANRKKRLGYFDDYNGVFFESRVDGLYIIQRSSASGAVTETAVSSSAFNADRADGTGPSGVSMSLSSASIFWIDIEWLGVGDVRAGIVVDHEYMTMHTFRNTNQSALPYMSTANLPVRYEIINTGTASGTDSLRAICAAVFNEGGQELDYVHYSTSTGSTLLKSVTTRTPVMSIRPRPALNGKAFRGQIKLDNVDVVSTGAQNMFFELVITSQPLTGASWNNIDPLSAVQEDHAASAITGGRTIGTIYTVGSTQRITTIPTESRIPLVVNFDGSNSDALVVMATSLGAANSTGVSISWMEVR